jgi:hypothetical protein
MNHEDDNENDFRAYRDEKKGRRGCPLPKHWDEAKRREYRRWYDRIRRPVGSAKRLRENNPEKYERLREQNNASAMRWRGKPESKATMGKHYSSTRRKLYHQSPAGRWKAHKNSARQRNIPLHISQDEAFELFASPCHYCGRRADTILNGIDRVDNDGPYSIANVVSSCSTCNFMKRDLSADDFLQHAIDVHRYQTLGIPSANTDGCVRYPSPAIAFRAYESSAQRRGLAFDFDPCGFQSMRSEPCAYCGVEGAGGIDRVDNDICYQSGTNCVACCKTCNFMKGDFDATTFLDRASAIAERAQ